ncbi:MAG: S8 family serine peptidase [Anaerolineales bacterium]|nr:S8 family serine peptidase [Anaerolineales bacterium]
MPPTPANPSPPAAPGCFSCGLLLLAGALIVILTAIVQGGGFLFEETLLLANFTSPGWLAVLGTWGQMFIVGVPLALLAAFTSAPRLRAVYLAWIATTLIAAVTALARVWPHPPTSPWAVGLQILLALACLAVVVGLLIARGGAVARRAPSAYLAPALALAPLLSLPFLLWGALGSLLDTALNLGLGLSLGLLTALLLEGLVLRPLMAHPAGRGSDLGLTSLAAVGLLSLLLSGFGLGGSQWLLLILLPPLGLTVAALAVTAARAGRTAWPAVWALVGLVAAAPLVWVDPDEMVWVLGDHEILMWAQEAAGLLFGLALLIGLITLVWAALTPPRAPGAPAAAPSLGGALVGAVGVALAWGLALGGYVFLGQPGLYGDRLFVILTDQADVSAAVALPDRVERLTSVYTTLVAEADRTQAPLRRLFDRLGVPYTPYYLLNALEVDAGPLLRLYLRTRPEVGRILDSPRLRPLPAAPPEGAGDARAPAEPEWNLTRIGADRVWADFGVTGAGIIVGQSDSGVQGDHPALAEGYRGRAAGDAYNWFDPWNQTAAPTDIGGHGTHTLGTAVGRGGIGVAPGAEWIGCVNLARNLANPALYLDCMQFMLAPFPPGGDPLHAGDPSRAAHVLNNSWGCPPLEGCDAAVYQPAVAALRAAGLFVVASAGNEGPLCGSVSSPIALYDEVFSVGAIDSSGDLVNFSSRGPVTVDGSQRLKPDLVAPGAGVLSSTPGGTYARYSGTSMAGPHVVGAVALLWSANPALIGDIDATEALLRDTARPYTGARTPEDTDCDDGPLPNDGVGYGVLDVYAAVQAALAAR